MHLLLLLMSLFCESVGSSLSPFPVPPCPFYTPHVVLLLVRPLTLSYPHYHPPLQWLWLKLCTVRLHSLTGRGSDSTQARIFPLMSVYCPPMTKGDGVCEGSQQYPAISYNEQELPHIRNALAGNGKFSL